MNGDRKQILEALEAGKNVLVTKTGRLISVHETQEEAMNAALVHPNPKLRILHPKHEGKRKS